MPMADTSNSPTMVFAVVITYQPNLEGLGVLLERLAGQVDTVLIIDNGSDNSPSTTWLKIELKAAQQLKSIKILKI